MPLDLLSQPLEVGLGAFAVGNVGPGTDDVLWPPFFVWHDREAVLDPEVVTAAMPKTVLDRPSSSDDQLFDLPEDVLGVLRMDVLGPEGRVVAHLPRQIAHDRRQVLTDEPAGIAVLGLRGGVDDRWAGGDERLQVLHDGHALAERLFSLLVVGDIRPGADKL